MANKRELTTILHDPRSTMRRLLKIWGTVPLLLMLEVDWDRGPLVLVGTADRMMSPLLPPGSLLQLDQTVHEVGDASPTAFERPIYLIEYRNKFYCCHWPPSFSVSLKEVKVRGQVTPIFRPLATSEVHKRHK